MKFLVYYVFFIVLLVAACSPFSIKQKAGKVHSKVEDAKKKIKDFKFDHKTVVNASHAGFIPAQTKCKYLGLFLNPTFPTDCHQHPVSTFEKFDRCPKHATCVPPIQCPAYLRMSHHPQLCSLPGVAKGHGLCCTTKQNHTTKNFFKKNLKSRTNERHMLDHVLHDAQQEFQMVMHQEAQHKQQATAKSLATERSFLLPPDFFHHLVFG